MNRYQREVHSILDTLTRVEMNLGYIVRDHQNENLYSVLRASAFVPPPPYFKAKVKLL